MTRSTNMEHVPHLQRMANEAWRGSPEHAALTAAIASLSAPQRPAEPTNRAESSSKLVDAQPPAEAKSDRMAIKLLVAAGFVTEAKANEALNIAHGFCKGPLAPPSAPLGVEVMALIANMAAYLRAEGGEDASPLVAHADRLLAQQPAAVDGADAKDDEIERLRAEREVIGAEAVKYAGKSGRLEAKVERLAEALRASLEAVQGALQDAYHSAGQECCGRGGMHGCCGMPEAVWTPEDQAVMDKLAPIQRLLNAALRDHDQEAGNDR